MSLTNVQSFTFNNGEDQYKLDISGKLDASLKGADEGLAELDENGKVPDSQLPDYSPPMVILSYGTSTWSDFIDAYSNNNVVYCRASSNSNPASGSQTRMAFMAYVNNAANPTNVEFQYYRSVNSHSDSQMSDQVFVYKLDKTSGWSVTTREAGIKQVVAGTNIDISYSSNAVTVNSTATAENINMSASDTTKISDAISGKADIVNNAVSGNFAALDSNGNLTDSGSKASDFLTSHQDITGKADKVSGATSGNFASLDSNGNITDSGSKASDFLTSHQDISGKADKVSNAVNGNFAALDSNGNLVDSGHKHNDYLTSHQDISGKLDSSEKGAANGVAELDSSGKVPTSQLPSNIGITYTLEQDESDGHIVYLTPSSGSPQTITIPDNNTWNPLSTTSAGYVDSPLPDENDKFLDGQGNWSEPPYPVTSVAGKTGDVTLVKGDVGLGNVDNTSDLDKPISTAVQTALTGKIDASDKGVANGLAELDANGKVPTSQLPSYVDDVVEYTAVSDFPATGETGKIYVATSTNLTYRWGGSDYVEISPSLALGTTSSTAYRGDYGAAAYAHGVTNKGSAFSSGLYKITTNSEGHVTAATPVVKNDITGLGIPGSDTTYESKEATSGGTDVSLVTTGEKYTWNSKTSNTGTVTQVSTGAGLTGGDITTTGTVKANLTSETKLSNAAADGTETSGRVYPVRLDKNGKLAVNVPWSDNDTKNTAGSTDTSSKLYLIGATTQAANPQTYSQDTAYVGVNGKLYSGGNRVVESTGDTMTGKLTLLQGCNQLAIGSGTAGQAGSASAAYIPTLWTFDLGMSPGPGDMLTVRIPVDGVSSGVWMSVDNGSTYYPVAVAAKARFTTHFGVGEIIELVFETGMTTTMYGTDETGAAAGSTTSDEVMNRWCVVNFYDTNTTYSNVKLGHGYATCTTAASTIAKVASLSSYKLSTGGYVSVKFSNDVPAGATLNINSQGAKAIYYKGAAITDGVIKAGDTAMFVYSSRYHLVSVDSVAVFNYNQETEALTISL